ncbi:MAG: N-acyl homoserine lactonase family protein [Sphingosinicella sp.]|nr:N-acyl homoserine lactonase family protein [Sphingosinicella sp.]
MKKLLAATAFFFALSALQAPPPVAPKPTSLKLWRLDCGSILIKDYNAYFSDTSAYTPGQQKNLTASCYLIQDAGRYLLWDTGLTADLLGKPEDSPAQRMSLDKSIGTQLGEIGVRPDQIEMVGISHFHFDHIGQAAQFPKAKLVIGAEDLAALRATPAHPSLKPEAIKPWLAEGSNALAVRGDVDIFKDGRVIMLNMPGHTPGHHSLLVKLASGPILLTGDLYHFSEQVPIKGVPPFNTDRADTLASMDRFDKMAANLGAKVIIQHERADIAKLPAFPLAAE